MKIYILRDDDPHGGYYCGSSWKPDMRYERKSVSEVRVVDMPEETWKFILKEGGAPLDDDGSNDSTWFPWWREGETIWERS